MERSCQVFAREPFTRCNYCIRIKELGGHEVAVDTLETKMVLRLPGMELRLFGVISGLRRVVDAICGLLGFYAAWSGNSLPTFRDDLSVPSSRVTYAAQSGKALPMFWDHLSAPFSSLDR